jgi:hypothetical protein
MAISIKSRKAKARRLQNDIAARISDVLDIPVEKDGDIEPRQMGMNGVDIILRGEAKKRFNFAVECKSQELFSLPAWVKQAKANLGDFEDWLLFISKNNWKPVVVMDVDTFFKYYRRILSNELH